MIKWGIIGAGNIARRFAKALSYDNRAVLQAISCRTLKKAQAFQENYGGNIAYGSFQELLDDKSVEAVYIALPHKYHFEWIKKALLANKKVLVEKPAVMNEAEMKEIIDIVKNNDCLFMEAMKNRFVPAYIKAKELFDNGTIGELKELTTCFCGNATYNPDSYLFDSNQGGGLLDIGIYNISYVDDFIKLPLQDLSVEYALHECGVDSYVNASLDYGDVKAIVECAIDRKKENKAVLYGTKGKMEIIPLHRPEDIRITLNDGSILEYPTSYDHDDFYSEIKHFNDLIINHKNESLIMSCLDSLNCAKIISLIKDKIC